MSASCRRCRPRFAGLGSATASTASPAVELGALSSQPAALLRFPQSSGREESRIHDPETRTRRALAQGAPSFATTARPMPQMVSMNYCRNLLERSCERAPPSCRARHRRGGAGSARVPAARQAAGRTGGSHAWRGAADRVFRDRVLAEGRPAEPRPQHSQELSVGLVRPPQTAARSPPTATADATNDPGIQGADGGRRRRCSDHETGHGHPASCLQICARQGRALGQPRQGCRKPTVRRARAVVAIAPNQVEQLRTLLLDGYVEMRTGKEGAARRVEHAPDPVSAMLVSLLAYEGLRPEEALALEERHAGRTTL